MAIEDEAAEWAVRADGGGLNPAEQARLDAWLAKDIRCLGAYTRARAMLIHARRAKAFGPAFDPDAVISNRRVIESDALSFSTDETPTRRRILVGGSAVAAGTAIAAIGLSWPAAAETYSTRRGEIRLIPLSDGSSMTLNTASKVVVRYGSEERRVDLIEGEAIFDVVGDIARPFVVAAGVTRISGLSTSFAVRRLDLAPVEVIVRQGYVMVMQSADSSRRPVRVDADMRAQSRPTQPMVPIKLPPAEVGRELAWRGGMLSFEEMPLAEAARQFARYSGVRIRVATADVGAKTVTGLFAANNPAGFARAAAVSLDLHVEREPDGVILSDPRDQPK